MGIAEAVADILVEGVYQHSGCAIVLGDVRWDDVGCNVAAFMKATKSAMQQLVAGDWGVVLRSERQSASESQLK